MSSTCPERRPQRRRTRVIAHRGASGYLPEHTTAAKILAYGLGADLLEQDLVATRDHRLIVLHDLHLDEVSDVELRFPERRRRDGRFHVIDFTRDELALLRLRERRRPRQPEPQFPARFPFDSDEFRIVAFEDEIRLIAGLNRTTGRSVGIYPEIKEPGRHGSAGVDLTRLVHEALQGCRELLTGPVLIQCFETSALVRLRTEFATPWPLVQLLTREDAEALADDPARRAEIRALVDTLGLPYASLIAVGEGGRPEASGLAQLLIGEGFALHPYALRRDQRPPLSGIDYRTALRFLVGELEVDAVFCDFPDDAVAVRDDSAA